MTCLDLDALVYPYLDGELEEPDRKDLEEHLGACPSCAERVGGEAAFHGALRRSVRVQRAPAPETLKALLHAGIQREHRRVQILSWVRWGSTALLAAAAGAAILQLRPPPPDTLGEEAALRFHRRLPLEVTPPTHEQIETWFDDKLDWRVPVPRFPNARLAGARLSNVRERDAAYIGYEASPEPGSPPRRIGVFVVDDPLQTLSAPHWPHVQISSVHGSNVASWRIGDAVYEMVSDLDADRLVEILKGLHPATPLPTPNRAPLRLVDGPERSSRTATAYGMTRWPVEIAPASTR